MQGRDVLELVDDQPFVLAPNLGRDAFVFGQDSRGQEQDVLHVHPALTPFHLLVAGHDPGDDLGLDAGHRAAAGGGLLHIGVGMNVAHLRPLDLRGEVPQLRLVHGDA